MKKILISLSVVAAVAAAVVAGTTAFFSDTETSVGNTFSAGTIDIAIDSQNPWTSNYHINDLKPGEIGYINFDIQNVGQNPVNVSKNLSGFVTGTGTVSEPECTEQGGGWDNSAKACDWDAITPDLTAAADNNEVQTQILYDLSVKVYSATSGATPIWWQSIYTGAAGETLSTIYPTGGTGVALGMIPVGGHMEVTQSYHFNPLAGNEYQGDTLSFDMTIKGDQMTQAGGYTTVALENKLEGVNHIWDIVQDDIVGTLNYKNQGPTFDYNFTGTVTTAGINYTLVYVGPSGNYPYVGSVVLAQGTPSTTTITLGGLVNGSIDTGSITNGKIWLVPTTIYTAGGWDPANTLFETGLINYVKN